MNSLEHLSDAVINMLSILKHGSLFLVFKSNRNSKGCWNNWSLSLSSVFDPVHAGPFSFENANIYLRFQKYFCPHDSVFESFLPVCANTDTRCENGNDLFGLQNYPTKHFYVLVKPKVFKVLIVLVLCTCQGVWNWPLWLWFKVTSFLS